MSIPPLSPTGYADITQEVLEAELMVVIRHNGATIADLRTIFDSSFAALGRAMSAGQFIAVGPAYAVYYGDPQGEFDLEVGFPAMGAPTNAIDSPAGRIHTSALPAGPAAVLSHVGSYEGMGASWQKLLSGAGAEPRGVWIEAYVSDPNTTAPENRRTDLILPLKP